jgi:holo-[acyl-carrier protein] synthase
MIIGIGVDIVDMRRIEAMIDRFGAQFTSRIFTSGERIYAASSPHPMRAYSNRFAAKEAAAKALGTGMKEGIGWQDIEISRAVSGAPSLTLHRKAHERLTSLLPSGFTGHMHVSFSDEPPYSTAFVVLSAEVKD